MHWRLLRFLLLSDQSDLLRDFKVFDFFEERVELGLEVGLRDLCLYHICEHLSEELRVKIVDLRADACDVVLQLLKHEEHVPFNLINSLPDLGDVRLLALQGHLSFHELLNDDLDLALHLRAWLLSDDRLLDTRSKLSH